MKLSINQFRGAGERVLWLDGRVRETTLAVVADIRARGFVCWRTGDQGGGHGCDGEGRGSN